MALQYENLRAKAAKWLLDNKDLAMWWSWVVLTAKNPDTTNPNIPEVSAFNIFTCVARSKAITGLFFDAAVDSRSVARRFDFKLACCHNSCPSSCLPPLNETQNPGTSSLR